MPGGLSKRDTVKATKATPTITQRIFSPISNNLDLIIKFNALTHKITHHMCICQIFIKIAVQ